MTTTTSTTVIHCWSAPRSRSSAFLYSWDSREDTVAIDEPLYRAWVKAKGDKVHRPYTQAFLTGRSSDDDDSSNWKREQDTLSVRIKKALEGTTTDVSSCAPRIVFCKHMAKHEEQFNFDLNCAEEEKEVVGESPLPGTVEHRHLFLIRDPVAVLSSWQKSAEVHGNSPTTDEVGIASLLSIYSKLERNSSKRVVVLDSDDLAEDPPKVLQKICGDLRVPYDPAMLEWKKGPKDCDGPWAKWWYEDVWNSTRWTQRSKMEPQSSYRTLPPALLPALRSSLPTFQFLKRLAAPPSPALYEDPRNANLLVWIGGSDGSGGLIPREMAQISPWDASVQGGDACWEGLRVYRGKILSLEKHMTRLMNSAKALGFGMDSRCHTRSEIIEAIFRTLAANGMRDGAHMRLTLTRGVKTTSSMNPKFNVYGTTLIILAEWKPAVGGATTYDNSKGITLISASQRRNPPQCVDSKIHHNNMINNILPKIQANLAGAADAIMLDVDGFVSETNATNIFMVDHSGKLLTPHADHCLPGITRATVLELARELDIPTEERRISLAEFHAAAEVFTTGTMGELTPVTEIDGRMIREGAGPVTLRLQEVYATLPEREGWATPLPEYQE